MRRRTKRLSSRRAIIYAIVIAIMLVVNYLRENSPAEAISIEPSATAQQSTPVAQSAESTENKEATSPKEVSAPAKSQYLGWAELPEAEPNDEQYITSHMCDEQMRNYTVCYSSRHHSPLWVAYPLHRAYEGEVKRVDNYDYDPTLPIDIQIRLNRSYGEYTRGHILGSAERNASREMNNQTFYVTNIAPQIQQGFNSASGAWNHLERFVDKQVCADTLYVVTGAIYDSFTDSDGTVIEPRTTTNKNDQKQVGVPTAFYKALLRTKAGNSGRSVGECKSGELKCAAFIVGHRSASGRKPSTKELISIDELERLTGVDFFKNVPNAPESEAVAADWGL